ncbi:hypothetical protein FRC08_000457 [Ceratobasidium sp. 394]|nr:hypothetical protein FRC08_000457 [Ceratobasidium sp. 394]
MPEPAVVRAIIAQKLPSRPQASIPAGSPDGDKLWELITRCWAKDPKERPPAAEVETIMSTLTRAGLSIGKQSHNKIEPSPQDPVAREASSLVNRESSTDVVSSRCVDEQSLGIMYALGAIE